MAAKIIFLEGPNYCGKSTITKALTEILDSAGKSFYTTYEPGGDEIGKGIRSILLDKGINDRCEMDYTCRRLLYAASHAQMLQQFQRTIHQYDYIIVDRYNPISDLIYGPGDEIDPVKFSQKIKKSETIFSVLENEFIIPLSHLIFLEISEDTMKTRDEKRNTLENKVYDFKSWDFKKEIRARYIHLSDALISNTHSVYHSFAPFKNIHVVYADGEVDAVARRIMQLIEHQEEKNAN